jgi:hypothetical protein
VRCAGDGLCSRVIDELTLTFDGVAAAGDIALLGDALKHHLRLDAHRNRLNSFAETLRVRSKSPGVFVAAHQTAIRLSALMTEANSKFKRLLT